MLEKLKLQMQVIEAQQGKLEAQFQLLCLQKQIIQKELKIQENTDKVTSDSETDKE